MTGEFFDLAQLAARWRVPEKRIRQWVHRGGVPMPIRLNMRTWLWPVEVVQQFEADRQRVETPAQEPQEA